MVGGRGGRRPPEETSESRDMRDRLVDDEVLRLDRYVSKTISLSFLGVPPLLVVWLSKSSNPVGSFDMACLLSCLLPLPPPPPHRRFRTMKNRPTISGIVIAQIINIKSGRGILVAQVNGTPWGFDFYRY